MSNDDRKINVEAGGTGWLAIALLLIFFYGKPDLCDALIHWLMRP